MLAFMEFYYRPEGLDTNFDPEFAADSLGSRPARASRTPTTCWRSNARTVLQPDLLAALLAADGLPAEDQRHLDGIDTDLITPDPSATFRLPTGPS